MANGGGPSGTPINCPNCGNYGAVWMTISEGKRERIADCNSCKATLIIEVDCKIKVKAYKELKKASKRKK